MEHRIETVRTVKGVTFINDSKGTNPDSTIKAIQTMDKPTVLILGGYDKGGEFDGLIKEYTDNIKHTVVLGDTARKIIGALERAGIKSILMPPALTKECAWRLRLPSLAGTYCFRRPAQALTCLRILKSGAECLRSL